MASFGTLIGRLVAVSLSLVSGSAKAEQSLQYRFSESDGKCKNSAGQVGFNKEFLGPCGSVSGSLQKLLLDRKDELPKDVRGLSATYLRIENSNLDSILFNLASLREAELTDVAVTRGDFRSVDLRGAILRNVRIEDSDFRFADLRGVKLYNVEFRNVNFSDADLSFVFGYKVRFKNCRVVGLKKKQNTFVMSQIADLN